MNQIAKKSFNLLLALGMTLSTVLASDSALKVGDTVPPLVVDTLEKDDSITTGESLLERGDHEFLVLEFFGTRCGECQENAPHLRELAENLSSNTTVKAIAIDRRRKNVFKYVSELREHYVFPVVLDSKRVVWKTFGLDLTPTLFLLNRDNEIIYTHDGLLKPADKEEIARLVGR